MRMVERGREAKGREFLLFNDALVWLESESAAMAGGSRVRLLPSSALSLLVAHGGNRVIANRRRRSSRRGSDRAESRLARSKPTYPPARPRAPYPPLQQAQTTNDGRSKAARICWTSKSSYPFRAIRRKERGSRS